jgi:hypothetical protein
MVRSEEFRRDSQQRKPSRRARLGPRPAVIASDANRLCAGRIGAKRITDTDYRRDSSRPHLLRAGTHAGVSHIARTAGVCRPTTTGGATPPRQSFSTARRTRRKVGSHLGSTLRPGRAVLTGGVSRRSGSVAYVRADASPSEVLAHLLACLIVPPRPAQVNSIADPPVLGRREPSDAVPCGSDALGAEEGTCGVGRDGFSRRLW